ncbi:zinc finger protein 723 isoform X1 [Halyomorpha halys]|uniref:zinc finger protein 723 isoform X1 n=2 Tax=Halyomorpha halys TaxID=286706 RepID=UPI0006D4E19D|nr:zinc finger protein 43-like isoform X1 [Halyomorpha halys]XP_024215360.1 zinc finger protein 43-like isoform X1 [Halyomorpha halys]
MASKSMKCVYPNCETLLTDKKTSFYAFPLNDEVCLNKWKTALGRPDFKPTKTDLICGKHFSSKCFENNILKPDSVPVEVPWLKERIDEVAEFDICRLCGKAKQMLMTDIFDDDLDICEKMSLCLPIVVNPNDSLPQTICDDCFDHLDIAANLIKKCIETEAKLTKLFSNPQQLRNTNHKPIPLNGPIVCDRCDVYFTDMALFDQHMSEHEADEQSANTDEIPLKVCSDCGHVFSEDFFYDEHKVNCDTMCNTCEKVLENNCKLNSHVCAKYSCELCPSEFRSESLLKKHVLQSHINRIQANINQEEKIEMEECESSGEIVDIKPTTVTRNGKVRPRKELYHCNICDIKFTSNKKLRDHCVELHGTANVLWICKFCGKSMTTKVSLQIHQRIHFDSKPYICEWCGNGYRSRANLNQHQVIHTGIRKHSCPKCGKKFSRKAFVRTHMRVHTGERPYVCDICGHRFTQLGDMKRHRNRHQTPHIPAYPSDARSHACDICGHRFPHLSALKKHRLTHFTQPVTIIEEGDPIIHEGNMEVEVVEEKIIIE